MKQTMREIRVSRGMSRHDLSMLTGFPWGSIKKWESGERIPNAIRLQTVALALGVTMDEILLVERRARKPATE